MPFGYVSPAQAMRDKAEFARQGIARGRSCVTLQYEGGILMMAPNTSSALHKISEIYDRIAFAAVGRYNEYEVLRKAFPHAEIKDALFVLERLRAIKTPTIVIPGNDKTHASASGLIAHRSIAGSELHQLPITDQDVPLIPFPDWGVYEPEIARVFADFMKKSDVVMAIGSSLTITNFGPSVPPGKTIIHSTNDAGDINKDYRADHAVVGDAGLVIDALIAEISRQKGPGGGNALASLKEEVAAGKKAWLDEWAKFLNSDEMPLNQYRVIRDMMRTLDRDNVIITHDSGSPREQMIPFWETTAAGSYMGWGKSTQLGYGLGITMGAKLAAPNKLCINVMGDAAIGMTGMDIETAARNRIAILTVVFNNGVMGAERDVLKISDEKYGAMTVGGNYTKVAEGLNVAAARVEKPGAIVGALKDAVAVTASGAPFLLEFVVKEGRDFSRYA